MTDINADVHHLWTTKAVFPTLDIGKKYKTMGYDETLKILMMKDKASDTIASEWSDDTLQLLLDETQTITGVKTIADDTKFYFGSDDDISLEFVSADTEFLITGNTHINGTLELASGTTINEFSIDGTMAGNSDDAVPTEKAVVTYVAAQITAEDLDTAGDSGTGSVDLNSQSLTIAGTVNEIETAASGQTITIGLPDDVTIGSDLTVTDSLTVDTTTLVVNAAGYTDKVGIGTATPSSKLDICESGADTPKVVIDHLGAADNGGSLYFARDGVDKTGFWMDNADNLKFYAGSTRMTILQASGNVGIGVTDPDSLLEVAGTTHIQGAVTLDSTLDVTGNIDPTSYETTNGGFIDDDTFATASDTTVASSESIKAYVDDQVATADTWAEVLANGNTSGSTDVVIDAGQSLTVDTTTLVVNAAGYTDKVGIGVATPDGTLHVHTATAGAVSPSTSADDLTVENSTDAGISILTPDANMSLLNFGSVSDNEGASINWSYDTDIFSVGTSKAGASLILKSDNQSTAMTITSTQQFEFSNTGSALDTAFTFQSSSNVGIFTWDVGDDRFIYSDDILISSGEKLYFGDTGSSIEFVPPNGTGGHMLIYDSELIELTADDVTVNIDNCPGAFTVNNTSDRSEFQVGQGYTATISNATDAGGLIIYGNLTMGNLVFSVSSDDLLLDLASCPSNFIIRNNADRYAFKVGDDQGTTISNATDAKGLIIHGDLILGNAYQAGAPTATGYIVIKDSNGTAYKIPAEAV